MLGYLAKKIFGTRGDKILKSLRPTLEKIIASEEGIKVLSDDQLKAKL